MPLASIAAWTQRAGTITPVNNRLVMGCWVGVGVREGAGVLDGVIVVAKSIFVACGVGLAGKVAGVDSGVRVFSAAAKRPELASTGWYTWQALKAQISMNTIKKPKTRINSNLLNIEHVFWLCYNFRTDVLMVIASKKPKINKTNGRSSK